MPYDIIIGRDKVDKKKFGIKGTIFLGKQYVKMGQTTSLSNNIYMDVARSHVVFVCGKRGSGKSYSMGVMAEGMASIEEEVAQNLSVVIFDTMGVYWTMKYENKEEADQLEEWGIKPKSLNVKIFTPIGYFEEFKKQGIPTDFAFAIKPSELSAYDWCLSFNIKQESEVGVLIERAISNIQEKKKDYDIDDIIKEIKSIQASESAKMAAENRFLIAKSWGLFSKKGTKIKDITKRKQVSVIDLSCYAITLGAEGIRALVIGLLSKKLFINRMIARKKEEFESVKASESFVEKEKTKLEEPLVWLIVDEAHEFLPREGKTAASDALITILREGRQPGISLILASQQPGKIHTDVMTQADIVLAHRITAKIDTDALGTLMQSYMREGLDVKLNNLPKIKGAGIIFDDTNERIFPMQVRPRFTWHGGKAPSALRKIKKEFEF